MQFVFLFLLQKMWVCRTDGDKKKNSLSCVDIVMDAGGQRSGNGQAMH